MAHQNSVQCQRCYFPVSRCEILMWMAVTIVFTAIAQAQPPITALAFSTDYKHVIAGSQAGLLIKEWPGLAHRASMPLDMDSIHDVSFSPDGGHFLVAGGSPGEVGTVQLRRWPDLELVRSWSEHQDVIYAVAWRGDGKEWVSSSWDGYCRVCQIDAISSHVTMKSHSGPVLTARYISSGQIVSAGADRTIVVWDSSSGQPSKVLRQHTASVHSLACQTGESAKLGEPLLVSASDDRTVRFWQPSIGRMVRFHRFKSTPRAIAWTPDGKSLIVGCDDGRVFQLDPIQLTTIELLVQNTSVLNLVLDIDGKVCLSDQSAVKTIEKPK